MFRTPPLTGVPALAEVPGVLLPDPHALAKSASEVTAAPASKRVLARIYFLLRKICVDRREQREGRLMLPRAGTHPF
jgi:hypothetical protein